MINRNLTETSEELISLFLHCPEVTELDLSNNLLSKLPLEISFLTCLSKLDIRNNNFSNFEDTVNVLTTIKSLTELNIDLIDSNEAILVLNKLPNVQILNGRSTKEEDDDDDEINEIEEEEYKQDENNSNNKYLYGQMEQIEEIKNLESNSENTSIDNNNNSSGNKNNNNNVNGNEDLNNVIDNANIIKEEEYESQSIDNDNLKNNNNNKNNKEKVLTRNNNKILNEKELNPKNSYLKDSKNKSDSDNSKLNNINDYFSLIKNKNLQDLSIDLSNEEFNNLNIKGCLSSFNNTIDNFEKYLNSNENENENKIELISVFKKDISQIEENKNSYSNYLYAFLIENSKFKIIKTIFEKTLGLIIEKIPELNKNNMLIDLISEIFNSLNSLTNIISYIQPKIDNFENNYRELIDNIKIFKNNYEEIEKKLKTLENNKQQLLKQLLEDKELFEKRIEELENENKIMTEKLLNKGLRIITEHNQNSMRNIKKTNQTSPNISLNQTPQTIIFNNTNNMNNQIINHNKNKIIVPNLKRKNINNNQTNSISNNTFNNTISNIYGNNLTSRTRSPNHSSIQTFTYENSNEKKVNKYSSCGITLKTMKEMINEIYNSKVIYDKKCKENKLPIETMEQHMYTFLNKKYGLKNLVIDWARNIIKGIKEYSKLDSNVLLFGKIMRNEQEEDSRFIIQKLIDSISDLLLCYIKSNNPLKSIKEIEKMVKEKKNSKLFEEEWKGIIYNIYEETEAKEIENKIENFIEKKFQLKKEEIVKKYQLSRKNNNNNNNDHIFDISGKNNNMNINSNNKISRIEKYYLLTQTEENSILFNDFLKIVLDYHIKFRDKQLKNFVVLFKKIDTDKNGILNEEEFSELIRSFQIYNEDEVDNKIFNFLSKIDVFDNQKITFSECISFFQVEPLGIEDKKKNNNKEEESILERVCFGGKGFVTSSISKEISKNNSKCNSNRNIINKNENINIYENNNNNGESN